MPTAPSCVPSLHRRRSRERSARPACATWPFSAPSVTAAPSATWRFRRLSLRQFGSGARPTRAPAADARRARGRAPRRIGRRGRGVARVATPSCPSPATVVNAAELVPACRHCRCAGLGFGARGLGRAREDSPVGEGVGVPLHSHARKSPRVWVQRPATCADAARPACAGLSRKSRRWRAKSRRSACPCSTPLATRGRRTARSFSLGARARAACGPSAAAAPSGSSSSSLDRSPPRCL